MANEFRILGPFEVADENGQVQLAAAQAAGAAAVLVLRRGEVVATHRLIDDLWGAYPPKAAKAALHNYIAQVRRALGANVIVRRDPGYLLDVAPEQVDLDCFVRLTDGARASSDAAERAELLRAALALWRGPPLADLEDEPFALLEVPHLANLRVGACVDLIDAELELGHNASAIREIEVLLAAQPLSSYVWDRSMVALYRAGRDADALAAYERAAEALDQIGQFPGPELRQRQRQISTTIRRCSCPSRPRWPACRLASWRRCSSSTLASRPGRTIGSIPSGCSGAIDRPWGKPGLRSNVAAERPCRSGAAR